ncbi:MAG: PhzF family phenazine biosynthesis protein [Planctomycetota bacterium]
MSIPYYQVGTFTNRLFAGNPAGVCLLAQWLEDALLQKIAAENNLAETAFVVRLGKTHLHAKQISARGGELLCEDRGQRVGIAGRAVTYSMGYLLITDQDRE